MASSRAATSPAPFEAEYAASKFPLTAQAHLKLVRSGDYYRYTMHGTVRMTFYKITDTFDCSVVHVRDGVVYPLEYVHRDQRNRRRDVVTKFNWMNRTIHTTRGDGSSSDITDVRRRVWDPMSVQLAMRWDLASATAGARAEYAVIERGTIREYDVRFHQAETISVGEASFEAAKVTAQSGKRASSFWFAPNYAWLPVRMSVGKVTLALTSPPATAERQPAPGTAEPPRCE